MWGGGGGGGGRGEGYRWNYAKPVHENKHTDMTNFTSCRDPSAVQLGWQSCLVPLVFGQPCGRTAGLPCHTAVWKVSMAWIAGCVVPLEGLHGLDSWLCCAT